MEEAKLAYRVRTAEASDTAGLREAIGATLAHPDPQSRRGSYSGAASRGDILLLEHYDRVAHAWQIAAFVECHVRVDDNLSIRDAGTPGDEPQTAALRYLLDQAFNSFRPVEAQVKIRRDASTWLDLFRGIPGFYLEGEEYRRPHYWTIWRWDRQRARESNGQAQRATGQAGSQRLRPPSPPPGSGTNFPQRDPRPGGPSPNFPQRASRPGGPSPNFPQRDPGPGGSGRGSPPASRPGSPGGSSPQPGPRPGGPNRRPPGPPPRRPSGRPSGPFNPR